MWLSSWRVHFQTHLQFDSDFIVYSLPLEQIREVTNCDLSGLLIFETHDAWRSKGNSAKKLSY